MSASATCPHAGCSALWQNDWNQERSSLYRQVPTCGRACLLWTAPYLPCRSGTSSISVALQKKMLIDPIVAIFGIKIIEVFGIHALLLFHLPIGYLHNTPVLFHLAAASPPSRMCLQHVISQLKPIFLGWNAGFHLIRRAVVEVLFHHVLHHDLVHTQSQDIWRTKGLRLVVAQHQRQALHAAVNVQSTGPEVPRRSLLQGNPGFCFFNWTEQSLRTGHLLSWLQCDHIRFVGMDLMLMCCWKCHQLLLICTAPFCKIEG